MRCALSILCILLSIGATSCIDSRCTRDAECESGEVCNTVGKCIIPECVTDSQCQNGTVCESNACVAGCLTDADCDMGMRCYQSRCSAFQETCDCPLAPTFCLEDINPQSSTAGRQVCVPTDSGLGMTLFFGSVGCSHCQAAFSALVQRRDELESEGLHPVLVWVNLAGVEVAPETVETLLGGVDAIVIQDSDTLGIWAAYNADWYHLVIVDRHGCLSEHMGPVSVDDIVGAAGEDLLSSWRAAMSAECVEPTPDDDGEDVVESDVWADSGTDDGDVTHDFELIDVQSDPGDGDTSIDEAETDSNEDDTQGGGDEASDTSTDGALGEVDGTADGEVLASDGSSWDSDVSDAIAPDESEEAVDTGDVIDVGACLVEQTEPIEVGATVPTFTCANHGATSVLGATVSDSDLRETTWIAYFGACT